MKINAYIIKDFMESVELRSKLISDRLECKISRPGIYTECIKIRTNTIYVADPNELAGNNNMVKGGCFLLTSCPDYALLQAEADFLYPSSPVDRVTLLDLVLEVFEKFNTWEVALHDCLNSVTPLQDVGDCSLLFLRNPAGIYTNSFRILCYYETPRPRQLALYHEEDVDAFLSDDDINELLMHPDFADSWMSEGPERFCSLDQMVKVLYINIQINGKNLYRIVVNEYDNPFRDSDYTILNIFAGFVKKILQNDCSACFSHHPQDFDQTLLALSHNLIYSSQHLDALVKSCGWKQDDVYCCFKIFAVKDQMVGSLENACLRLEKIVDKSYAIIDEKYILFLVNLESCGKSCADVKAEMALHFRDFMLRAGISAEFRELKRLSQYYEQASIALAIGMKSDPTKWTYPFEQYALRYMARQCTELLDPKALCIPGLLRLMEYDRKKGRNYAQILRVYIDNNMNVAETTRKIFVQRATFLYQLKKIKEITGLNLKDPMTRFYLACSYYLLDFAGEGSEEV